jgi:hypothetical protein
VIDEASVSGHYAVFQEFTVGPCQVAGTIHEGSWLSVGTVVTEPETGPLRALYSLQLKKEPQSV